MKKTGLKGSDILLGSDIYFYLADTNDTLDISKYLMRRT